MGSVENKMESLKAIHPNIKLVEPSSGEYAQARMNAMGRGSDRTPLGFAIPQSAQEVSDLVRWARSSQTEFCIRSGGNDFYGRSIVDGGLVIDLKALNGVNISDNKKTVTLGGGITVIEVLEAVEKEGLLVPFGNTSFLGYVGWITMGGYGPLSSTLGMGFESIVEAELVNANGDVVTATEEMLEGLRGLGGNLGVVTSMTVKTYPARKFLSGPIIMDGTEANVRAITAAAKSFAGLDSAVLHHFVMANMADRTKLQLTTRFSWDGDDIKKGKEFLDDFVKAMSPVQANMVKEVTAVEFMNVPPYPSLPYGGNRSVIVKEIDSEVVNLLVDGIKMKPVGGNITWADGYDIDHGKVPKNTFGPGKHALITFSDLAPTMEMHEELKKWTDHLDETLKNSAMSTGMSYPPLMAPGARTVEEMMGDKYERAMELKGKYDPDNVFKNVVPRLVHD